MNPVLSILRAAHCRSTHHYLALDALPLVQTEAGKRLTSQLIRHHDRYLVGANDPDTRFRDFQNHVVHVTEGYWGGAPRVAHQWYDRLQRYLRTDRFGDAAHAAGVLSHYFTDPLQPLHTQQCDREKILHRPIEWSICKSYRQIHRIWKSDDLRIVFQLSGGPGWLGEAILHGARFANRKYHTLINRYNFDLGAQDPVAGIPQDLRESLAELVGLAITGWARLLERAASDAESTRSSPIPTAGLSMPMVLATLRTPLALWIRHVEHQRERVAIDSLVDEFRRTGAVVQHLPAEVDIVHRVRGVYHNEKRWHEERKRRLASRQTVIQVVATGDPAAQERDVSDDQPVILPFQARESKRASAMRAGGSLSRQDPISKSPGIGAKTAARFEAIDVHTVGHLIDSNDDELAGRLATYWITTDTVAQWQHQATLMCQIAGLRGCDAQLLAGAGFHSAAAVAAANETLIVRKVRDYAATTSGRRYLQGAAPPTAAQILAWQSSAIDTPSQRHSA